MAKNKEDKDNKIVRSSYYLTQVTPLLTYIALLTTTLVGGGVLADQNPDFNKDTLSQNLTRISSTQATIEQLNVQKKNSIESKALLEDLIIDIKSRRESEGSLRFYTINIPAYCRYVEFRANDFNVEIIDINIKEKENKVDYTLMGDYPDFIRFFTTLETREIYYIENFELLPSLTNSGSYVKFTANFNLDATIKQRYEKKVEFERPDTGGSIIGEDTNGGTVGEGSGNGSNNNSNSGQDNSDIPNDILINEVPTDTMNTNNQPDQSQTDSNSTTSDEVVNIPVN